MQNLNLKKFNKMKEKKQSEYFLYSISYFVRKYSVHILIAKKNVISLNNLLISCVNKKIKAVEIPHLCYQRIE